MTVITDCDYQHFIGIHYTPFNKYLSYCCQSISIRQGSRSLFVRRTLDKIVMSLSIFEGLIY